MAFEVVEEDVVFFAFTILFVFIALFVAFWVSWWLTNAPPSPSPYTGKPLRSAESLSYNSKEKVLRYLYEMHQYDNRMFDIRKAAFCRETGRLFPDSTDWFNCIRVDWSFLHKRFPGHYVSWGSLVREQQQELRELHGSLDDYQTTYSSIHPSPRAIEKEFALMKPGPLYVDVGTKILLGWKEVPGTDLEVLIVQRPKRSYMQPAQYIPKEFASDEEKSE